MIVIDQGGEWLWQKVQNIPNSLKRMQYSIAWIILSCHFASEEAKEIARLQRELRDTKDALEVLKKAIGILGN